MRIVMRIAHRPYERCRPSDAALRSDALPRTINQNCKKITPVFSIAYPAKYRHQHAPNASLIIYAYFRRCKQNCTIARSISHFFLRRIDMLNIFIFLNPLALTLPSLECTIAASLVNYDFCLIADRQISNKRSCEFRTQK